jgi:metallo-beta-lactamase class B
MMLKELKIKLKSQKEPQGNFIRLKVGDLMRRSLSLPIIHEPMPSFLRRLMPLPVLFILVTQTAIAQDPAPRLAIQPSWTRDYPPFRIAGNLYYVGSEELACYLIATPDGDILINAGVAGSDTMIRRHIEALGFRPADVKILLTNQAHFDHVGGMDAIKRSTRAQFMVDNGDAEVVADGGNSDFIFGGRGPLFEPVKADRVLHDLDTVRLGGSEILVLHHPGHTKGSCSFLFTVRDESREYRVLIANIPTILDETSFPGMATYPGVMKDYAYTLDTMPRLQFDLWFAAHAGQFGLLKKRHPGDSYNPMAFADRAGYDETILEQQRVFIRRVSQARL